MKRSPALPTDPRHDAPWSTGRRVAALAAVLSLALVLRLLAHAQMAAAADTFAPIIDGEAYLLQALRIAAGRGLADGVSFQAPLYPYLYGALLGLAGHVSSGWAETAAQLDPATLTEVLRLGRLLNLATGMLAVLVIWRLALRLFGDRAALMAGLLAAAYGPAIFHEGLVMKETLSLLVLPLAALAGARAMEAQSRGGSGALAFLAGGLALGAGGLVRGNVHAVAGLAAVVLVLRGGGQRRLVPGLRDAAALGCGVLCALAPMVLRNSLVAGRPVLATAAGGTAFYLCNHPDNDTGLIQHRAINRQVPRHEEQDWTAEAEARAGRELSPAEVSDFWLREALAGIAERPGRWLLAETRKLFLLASRYEAPDNTMPSFAEAEVAVLRWTPARYGLVLPLAAGGAWLAWTRRRRGVAAGGQAVLAFLAAAYAASLLLFVVTSRFRLPLAPLVLVWAGHLLGELPVLLRGHPWRFPTALAVGGMLLLTLACETPLGPLSRRELATHRVVCLKNRAQVAAARGALTAARADLAQALVEARSVGIDAPALHAELARLAREEARGLLAGGAGARARASELQSQAAGEVAAALDLAPGDGLALKEQGLLLYDTDQHAPAAEALAAARAALPRDRELLQYLCLARLQAGAAAAAEDPARSLIDLDAEADDGWGLLALSLARAGRETEARAALARHDLLVARRRLVGLQAALPELPEFVALRAAP